MRSNIFKAILGKSGIAASVLLLASSMSYAQQQINLTAGAATANLPDGSPVPMWGYTCAGVTGTAPASGAQTCAKLSPSATGWSPVVITVPTGQDLVINLTNSLSFTAGTGTSSIPTSLVIVGQLGGGLGDVTQRTTTLPPPHNPQGVTWPAADPTTINNPATQGPRVQSFSTEVAAGATTQLTWAAPGPGTYLIESGTHPSIQGPMGLYGILVVTTAPAGATAGTAYPAAGTTPAVTYNADIPLLFSEIDPVQNAAVAKAVTTQDFSETTVWSGQPGGCGNPATTNSGNCYPPAVNYTPLYYLINGVAFDKTNAAASLFPAVPGTALSPVAGTVLVRMVNAGLRMHVPSIVGAQTATPTASGLGLIAEDGNRLPGATRVQNEVFLAAGKTYDVTINVPAAGTALPIFDREGGLSGNATSRDAGMLAYISVNGAGAPGASGLGAAVANPDTYSAVITGKTLTVSDPAKGLTGNDVNVYGVQVSGTAPTGLALNANGTFTYTGAPTSFTYCANGTTTVCASVTLGAALIEAASGITANPDAYTSKVATSLSIKSPGVLVNDTDAAGYPLTAKIVATSGVTVSLNADGSFTATVATHAGVVTPSFTYQAINSQGTASSNATVSLNFPAPSNLQVTLIDGITKQALPAPADYRWIIEEDRTFFVDPKCQTNPLPAGCPVATPQGTPAIYGTNFHTAYMPVVADGCVGTISCESGQSVPGTAAACDIGNGGCRTGVSQKDPVDPSQVVLDTTKHYYISVLPGDAMDPGHAMGGAQLAATCTPVAPATTCTPTFGRVNIIVEPENQPPAQVSAFVFEDDHPLNGEHDASGGIDSLSPNEPGLGGFNITIIDLVGMSGDSAGQLTYDEFGQPLSNGLAGTPDPSNGGIDACPISKDPLTGFDGTQRDSGITGVIPVCPKYEADGTTLSPLAGQVVVNGMPPGRYGIIATPAADRIARGEEWLQTNTLDGGKDHEAFIKVNEPSYFQEFGPAGYHVSIGFANPKGINDQGTVLCATLTGAAACTHTVTGVVTGARMSRTPDQRLYSSGNRDTFSYTQCYVSLGSPDGADIRFAKCQDDGSFTLPQIPTGDWKITIFDQWNDQIVDGITTPVHVAGDVNMGEIGSHGWKNNLYTRTFFDVNGDGISNVDAQGNPTEPGLSLVPTNIRYRDGSLSNLNSTDL